METMFDTLLQLPLFQGLCNEDFTKILEKVKLNFSRHKAGEVILENGAPCKQLFFLLRGEMTCETISEDGSLTIIEYINSPYLIEPHALVGIAPYYASGYTARTEIHTISISKETVFNILFNYEIFRLNFLNIVSRRAQNLHARLWEKAPDNLEDKFLQFVLTHVERPEGEKILKVKMEDLAKYLDVTRLNVSRTLNRLEKKKLLELHRKEIYIPNVALLSDWYYSK